MMKDPIVVFITTAVIFWPVGFLLGEQIGLRHHAEQIRLVEVTCNINVPEGYTTYPVTRSGELRGCMDVPLDESDWKKVRRFRRIDN